MGKKKKNKAADYFNMTVEEQKATAEMLHAAETGEISFLDSLDYKVPTSPKYQSSFKRQIEMACIEMMNDKKYENYESNGYIADTEQIESQHISDADDIDNEIIENVEDDYEDTSEYEQSSFDENQSYIENIQNNYNAEINKTKSVNDNIARINFEYNSIIGRLMIDDGYIATPVSVIQTSSIQIDNSQIPEDSDELTGIFSKIFYYIISCKHPAVIMSEDTFEIEFSMFSKINFNKFIFFKNNGFVYAYVLDENVIDTFYEVASIFNLDNTELLSYVIGTAYAAHNIHNKFMYNDEDEVESVMDDRHSIKDLIKLIEEDPETDYAGHHSSGDVLSRMKVTDLQSFVSDVYNMMENLIEYEDSEVEEDCNESDDCDEWDVEDDDVDPNDFPDSFSEDSFSGEISPEINQLIDEVIDELDDEDDSDVETIENVNITETSTTTNIEVVKTSNSDEDDMILPIIHRNR